MYVCICDASFPQEDPIATDIQDKADCLLLPSMPLGEQVTHPSVSSHPSNTQSKLHTHTHKELTDTVASESVQIALSITSFIMKLCRDFLWFHGFVFVLTSTVKCGTLYTHLCLFNLRPINSVCYRTPASSHLKDI